MSISSRCFFFFCGTDCMYGDKVLDCRVAECPTYAAAGVLDDCCETCRYYIVSTPTPRANSTALPSKKNSIHDTMEFMSLLHCLVLFIDFIVTGLVSIVRKFIAWVRWFSELFLLLAWVIPVAAGGGGGLLLIVIIIVACCCCRKSPSERAELKYRPDAVKT